MFNKLAFLTLTYCTAIYETVETFTIPITITLNTAALDKYVLSEIDIQDLLLNNKKKSTHLDNELERQLNSEKYKRLFGIELYNVPRDRQNKEIKEETRQNVLRIIKEGMQEESDGNIRNKLDENGIPTGHRMIDDTELLDFLGIPHNFTIAERLRLEKARILYQKLRDIEQFVNSDLKKFKVKISLKGRLRDKEDKEICKTTFGHAAVEKIFEKGIVTNEEKQMDKTLEQDPTIFQNEIIMLGCYTDADEQRNQNDSKRMKLTIQDGLATNVNSSDIQSSGTRDTEGLQGLLPSDKNPMSELVSELLKEKEEKRLETKESARPINQKNEEVADEKRRNLKTKIKNLKKNFQHTKDDNLYTEPMQDRSMFNHMNQTRKSKPASFDDYIDNLHNVNIHTVKNLMKADVDFNHLKDEKQRHDEKLRRNFRKDLEFKNTRTEIQNAKTDESVGALKAASTAVQQLKNQKSPPKVDLKYPDPNLKSENYTLRSNDYYPEQNYTIYTPSGNLNGNPVQNLNYNPIQNLNYNTEYDPNYNTEYNPQYGPDQIPEYDNPEDLTESFYFYNYLPPENTTIDHNISNTVNNAVTNTIENQENINYTYNQTFSPANLELIVDNNPSVLEQASFDFALKEYVTNNQMDNQKIPKKANPLQKMFTENISVTQLDACRTRIAIKMTDGLDTRDDDTLLTHAIYRTITHDTLKDMNHMARAVQNYVEQCAPSDRARVKTGFKTHHARKKKRGEYRPWGQISI